MVSVLCCVVTVACVCSSSVDVLCSSLYSATSDRLSHLVLPVGECRFMQLNPARVSNVKNEETGVTDLELFEFLGRMMGISLVPKPLHSLVYSSGVAIGDIDSSRSMLRVQCVQAVAGFAS